MLQGQRSSYLVHNLITVPRKGDYSMLTAYFFALSSATRNRLDYENLPRALNVKIKSVLDLEIKKSYLTPSPPKKIVLL